MHMDHKTLIKSLPPPIKAQLTARSDRAGLRHLALYLAALLLTSAAIALRIPLWPLLLIPQGILLAFLFKIGRASCRERV